MISRKQTAEETNKERSTTSQDSKINLVLYRSRLSSMHCNILSALFATTTTAKIVQKRRNRGNPRPARHNKDAYMAIHEPHRPFSKYNIYFSVQSRFFRLLIAFCLAFVRVQVFGRE